MSDLLTFSPPGALDTGTKSFAGAKATFFNAGTTTPRTVYTDQAESVPAASPLVADAAGLWPEVFASGGAVKVVVTYSDDTTGYTLDPCLKVAASGAGAAGVSFAPTIDIPATNVQQAIELAAASAASGFTPFGLGVTGSVALIASIDATGTATGQYRFDATTTGTYPTGVVAADTGAVMIVRETSGTAWMWLYHDTTDRVFIRRMTTSVWGAWRENITANIGAVEGDLLYRTGTAWTRLPKGTAGQALKMNAGATAPEWGQAGPFTMLTQAATTSGSNFDFTVPSTATELIVLLDGVSLSGTDNLLIQLIDGGGAQATGYVSLGLYVGTAGGVNSTAGMAIALGTAGDSVICDMRLTKMNGNKWVSASNGTLIRAGAGLYGLQGAGTVTLDDACVGVRLTRTGTNTFDAGSVNVGWR